MKTKDKIDYYGVFKMDNLTNNEKLILLYFTNYCDECKTEFIKLTNEEIGTGCSITGRTASSVVKSLIKKEIIERTFYNKTKRILKITIEKNS